MLSKSRKRTRELSRKFFSSPTLPLLGWTKAVESVVTSGPILDWIVYAVLVTCVWIYADHLKRYVEDAADQAKETADEVGLTEEES